MLERMGVAAESIPVRIQLPALLEAPAVVPVSAPTSIASTAAAATPAGGHGLMAPLLSSGLSVACGGRPARGKRSGLGQEGERSCKGSQRNELPVAGRHRVGRYDGRRKQRDRRRIGGGGWQGRISVALSARATAA